MEPGGESIKMPCTLAGSRMTPPLLITVWVTDVLNLTETVSTKEISCNIGMATAAAYFHPQKGEDVEVAVDVPLQPDFEKHFPDVKVGAQSWDMFVVDTPV